jgi:cytochrome c biogenesis factor
MGALLAALQIGAVLVGILTPIIFRRLRGGPFRFSRQGSFEETMGFVIAMMVTNPIGLLLSIAISPIILSSETTVYASLAILNLGLGIIGGWVWVAMFVQNIHT